MPVPRSAYEEDALPSSKAALNPSTVGHVAVSARRASGDGLTGSKLVCAEGPYFDQVFPLTPHSARTTIGRASDCDIALPSDRVVSRHHATVHLTAGRHLIEDIKSANGTFLNDVPLRPYDRKLLKPGDLVRIGDTILRYE